MCDPVAFFSTDTLTSFVALDRNEQKVLYTSPPNLVIFQYPTTIASLWILTSNLNTIIKWMKFQNQLLILLLLFGMIPLGNAMGFFDAMTVTLFSEMKGVITQGGEPVSGAVVTRTAIPNNDKTYTDSATTDSAGVFSFRKLEANMFLKLLPTSIVVSQKVVISYQGNQYLAWQAGNTNGVDKGELNEHDFIGTDKEVDINLQCELNSNETDKAGAYTLVISGICNWEGQKILD